MKNKYGATVTNWGNVDNIGTQVERVGGLGVRYPTRDPRSPEQRQADRELFLRDPKAYIEKCQREGSKE